MRSFVCLLLALAFWTPLFAAEGLPPGITASDWPWWRGPAWNGIASAEQTPPLKWGDSEHVIWKMPVPGRGHGSPIVVGEA